MKKLIYLSILCIIVSMMISCNETIIEDNTDWRVFPVEYIEPYFPFSEGVSRTFVSEDGDTISYTHNHTYETRYWYSRIFDNPEGVKIEMNESYLIRIDYSKYYSYSKFIYFFSFLNNRNILEIGFNFRYNNQYTNVTQQFNNPTPENPNNIFSLLTDTIELYQSDVLCAKIVKYEGPVWFLTYTKDESDGTIIGQTEWRLANISLTDK